MPKQPNKFLGGADDESLPKMPTLKKRKQKSRKKPDRKLVERVAKETGFDRRVTNPSKPKSGKTSASKAKPARPRGRPKGKVQKEYWSIYLPTHLKDELLALRDEQGGTIYELLADMLEAYKRDT